MVAIVAFILSQHRKRKKHRSPKDTESKILKQKQRQNKQRASHASLVYPDSVTTNHKPVFASVTQQEENDIADEVHECYKDISDTIDQPFQCCPEQTTTYAYQPTTSSKKLLKKQFLSREKDDEIHPDPYLGERVIDASVPVILAGKYNKCAIEDFNVINDNDNGEDFETDSLLSFNDNENHIYGRVDEVPGRVYRNKNAFVNSFSAHFGNFGDENFSHNKKRFGINLLSNDITHFGNSKTIGSKYNVREDNSKTTQSNSTSSGGSYSLVDSPRHRSRVSSWIDHSRSKPANTFHDVENHGNYDGSFNYEKHKNSRIQSRGKDEKEFSQTESETEFSKITTTTRNREEDEGFDVNSSQITETKTDFFTNDVLPYDDVESILTSVSRMDEKRVATLKNTEFYKRLSMKKHIISPKINSCKNDIDFDYKANETNLGRFSEKRNTNGNENKEELSRNKNIDERGGNILNLSLIDSVDISSNEEGKTIKNLDSPSLFGDYESGDRRMTTRRSLSHEEILSISSWDGEANTGMENSNTYSTKKECCDSKDHAIDEKRHQNKDGRSSSGGTIHDSNDNHKYKRTACEENNVSSEDDDFERDFDEWEQISQYHHQQQQQQQQRSEDNFNKNSLNKSKVNKVSLRKPLQYVDHTGSESFFKIVRPATVHVYGNPDNLSESGHTYSEDFKRSSYHHRAAYNVSGIEESSLTASSSAETLSVNTYSYDRESHLIIIDDEKGAKDIYHNRVNSGKMVNKRYNEEHFKSENSQHLARNLHGNEKNPSKDGYNGTMNGDVSNSKRRRDTFDFSSTSSSPPDLFSKAHLNDSEASSTKNHSVVSLRGDVNNSLGANHIRYSHNLSTSKDETLNDEDYEELAANLSYDDESLSLTFTSAATPTTDNEALVTPSKDFVNKTNTTKRPISRTFENILKGLKTDPGKIDDYYKSSQSSINKNEDKTQSIGNNRYFENQELATAHCDANKYQFDSGNLRSGDIDSFGTSIAAPTDTTKKRTLFDGCFDENGRNPIMYSVTKPNKMTTNLLTVSTTTRSFSSVLPSISRSRLSSSVQNESSTTASRNFSIGNTSSSRSTVQQYTQPLMTNFIPKFKSARAGNLSAYISSRQQSVTSKSSASTTSTATNQRILSRSVSSPRLMTSSISSPSLLTHQQQYFAKNKTQQQSPARKMLLLHQ